MSKSLNTEIYWDDWYRDTDRLTYAEKGLWIDLIGRTVNAPQQGVFSTALQKMAGCGTCEGVWRLLVNLAVKGVADVWVEGENGGDEVQVGPENARRMVGREVDDYTRVRVVCRRVLREAATRKKDAERQAKRRECDNSLPLASADRGRTERGQQVDAGGDAGGDTARIKNGFYHLLPSSTYLPTEDKGNQDSGMGVEGKPRRRGKGGRVSFNTALMVRIGGWFGMKATTLWTEEQAEKLKGLKPTEDELGIHEAFYAIEEEPWRNFRRRNLITQLNNWVDDLIKHAEWTKEHEERGGKNGRRMVKRDVSPAVC